MDNSCLICLESSINDLIGLHNRIIADHKVCSECFDIWYIKNKHSYNCIMCRELIDINNLPNDIKEKIHSKPIQVHNIRLQYIRPRYFRLINNITGRSFGRYRGKTPKQAANKVFTSLVKRNQYNNEIINFSIIECTLHSEKKIYKYTGERINIENGFSRISRNNNQFQYKFKNKIYSLN
jgi:hypothetical protein